MGSQGHILSFNYLAPIIYPQGHFVLSTGKTLMRKIDTAPCGTYILVRRGGDKLTKATKGTQGVLSIGGCDGRVEVFTKCSGNVLLDGI